MCSPSWETRISTDMCSPTWETCIPSEHCIQCGLVRTFPSFVFTVTYNDNEFETKENFFSF